MNRPALPRATRRGLVLLVAGLVAMTRPAGAADSPGTLTLGGRTCDLIAVPTDGTLPAGSASCPGVRPGALVETDKGYCTLNFVFRGSDGARYIGTAGHCILSEGPTHQDVGERVWRPGRGPAALDANGVRIGRFVYAILKSPKDFALIRLDRGVLASPRMCYFGGPTGIDRSTGGPALLRYFGNGTGLADAAPARTALAPSKSSPDHVYALGAIAPGDSGSGLIGEDGRALGVIVTIGAHASRVTDFGVIGATRLAPQLARAAKMLRIQLRLLTAPLS